MWDLGNRGIIVLISALAGCVFAYNSTVSILVVIVTVTLILVSAYACYCLFVSDSSVPFPRHGIHQVGCFIQETVRQLNDIFEHTVSLYFLRYLRNFRDVIQRFYNERIANRMQKPRSSIGYQLSTDASISRSPSSRFGTIDRFSPIPRLNAYESENAPPRNSASQRSPANENRSFSKYTSTPLVPWRKDDSRNGDLTWNGRSSSKKTSQIHTQNHSGSLGENSTYYNSGESSWASGANPKMRPKVAGVKTVQTTAGPLLASTRYNIDPKVYSDVISPGLTTRLSKYAMEANDKLTHQSQYGTGQFPRVNLNASPVPLINTKVSKARTPVMVRIAPPEVTRYSPPERQKILSNMCLRENKEQNVAHVLREISLKRHASGEDVTSDLAKKQRTDNAFTNNVIENVEESTQKRNRDESSKSEEDLSLDNKTVRPTKRSKAPSCYDILNSLSSSVHVISGVKRKADLSRSGTPDFGKHFKSIDSSQGGDAQGLSRSLVGSSNQGNDSNEKYSPVISAVHHNKRSEGDSLKKGILQSPNKDYVHSNKKVMNSVHVKEKVVPTNDVQLKDKLFMRAEPQKNEKLRLLVEEHSDVKAKFTTDDVEEIRKEDIVNMRQTSMRARLQSMFDAISGKTKSKINPDVVIQAEDVTASNAVVTPPTCATLNSATTTTSINTSPIATSAIAPIESAIKSTTKSTKHVTFNLPVVESSTKPNNIMSVAATPTNAKVTSSILDQNKPTPAPTVITSQPASSVSSIFSTINASSAPAFTFGSPSNIAVSTTSSTKSSNLPSTNTVPATSTFLMNDSKSAATPPNNNQLLNLKSQLSAPSSTSVHPVTPTVNPSTATSSIFGNSSVAATPVFGNKTSVPLQQNVLGTSTPNAPVTTGYLQTSTANIAAGITTPKTATNPVAISTPSTPMFTFGTNSTSQTTGFNTPQTTKSTGFTLGASNPPNTNIFGTVTTASTAPTTSSTGNAFSATVATTPATTASDKNATNTLPAFGAPAATTSVFSFGTNSTLSTSNNKPAFSFNTSSTSAASTTSSAMPLFGASTNSSATPSFGTISTTATQQFGATTAPVFGSTQSAAPFGTPSLFSGITSPSSSASTTFSTLKTSSATNFNSSTATPTFGTPKTTASNLFSNVNSDANTTTSTSKPPAFGTTASAFGQATASWSFGTSSTVFGNTTTPLFGSQTTTGNTFGVSNTPTTTASSFGNAQNLPAFGTSNAAGTTGGITSSSSTTTPVAFGASNTNPNTGFGSGTTTPAFGSSTTSSNAAPSSRGFGTPSTSSATFGTPAASSLAFGTANNSSNAFASNVSSPFGGTQANTSATPAFGSSTSTPAFGNSGNTAPNSTFSFGGTQPSLQQNTTFSFGSNTATSNAGTAASTPFQFGASSAKPASTGFNFSAPPATPNINFGSTANAAPVFNAPTAGMFSIGSGSTAPRSRSTRPRKPR